MVIAWCSLGSLPQPLLHFIWESCLPPLTGPGSSVHTKALEAQFASGPLKKKNLFSNRHPLGPTQPYSAIPSHTNHTQPYSATLSHTQRYSGILSHTQPYTAILSHTQPYPVILRHIQPHSYSAICSHTQPLIHIQPSTAIFSHSHPSSSQLFLSMSSNVHHFHHQPAISNPQPSSHLNRSHLQHD